MRSWYSRISVPTLPQERSEYKMIIAEARNLQFDKMLDFLWEVQFLEYVFIIKIAQICPDSYDSPPFSNPSVPHYSILVKNGVKKS